MKCLLWLLTFIPSRILLPVLGALDFLLFISMSEEGLLENTVLLNVNFLAIVATVFLFASIAFAVIGGVVGYKYVEMERSRRWHYRANKYDDYNGKLNSIFYWACKFFCIPIIWALIMLLVYEIYVLV